ncbi:uncharacterized protein G2W53_036345 [Senna tora]|uniref:Uncharacterized protein n=1 Tax=Senna tora TaxID=362788 RepID=A0A834W501_9FABA|nr:uncharacterized protein G2W53_036345 [Senna tora]
MSGLYTASEVHCHVRSISLPSRLHPTSQKIETQLEKLRKWDSLISSSSADIIKAGLRGLAELYNCVHQFLDSPLNHHQEEERHLEKALDMSVGLLDVCGSARDLFLLMKEHVQDLHSLLRRKGLDYSSIKTQINAYISFRKKVKKDISKSLRSLKTMESSFKSSYPLLNTDHHGWIVIKVLRELSSITISFFRKLLLFLCVPVLKKNSSGLSLISRMVFKGNGREKRIISEMEGIDIALCYFHRAIEKSDAKTDVHVVKRKLQELDGNIREFETELDCLFRCLIQHRVSLLNLLTP